MTIPLYLLMSDPSQYKQYLDIIEKIDSAPLYMVQKHRETVMKFLDETYKQRSWSALDRIASTVQE